MATDQQSRFVPVLRQELVELLRETLVEDERELFGRFATLLHATLHYEFHERLERLRQLYRPFDPDPIATSVLADDREEGEKLIAELKVLLEQANFREVTHEELGLAFDEESLFTLSVNVELDDYAELLLFRRGETSRIEKIRSWRTLWKWQEIEVELFERLVLALRLKPEALDEHRKLGRVREMQPGKIYLKFFKNIPKADLEMIFPTTRLGMKAADKLKLGIPLAGGIGTAMLKLVAAITLTAGGVTALTSPDSTTLKAIGAVLILMAGYVIKSFNNYKTTKLTYMQTLSEGLYFKNLDNNIGVIHHLLSAAEEEETKEALLAYYFLLRADTPLSQTELDRRVEQWFVDRFDRHFDFEVEDGLAKLARLKLITDDRRMLKAVDLKEALQVLDQRWDSYFDYRKNDKSD